MDGAGTTGSDCVSGLRWPIVDKDSTSPPLQRDSKAGWLYSTSVLHFLSSFMSFRLRTDRTASHWSCSLGFKNFPEDFPLAEIVSSRVVSVRTMSLMRFRFHLAGVSRVIARRFHFLPFSCFNCQS